MPLVVDLLTQIKAAGLIVPVTEYQFALHFSPPRKWRWDYCWPDRMLAVEVSGAVHVAGKHTRGKGYERDTEKWAEGVLMGYRVMVFTTGQVASGYALNCIMKALIRFGHAARKNHESLGSL